MAVTDLTVVNSDVLPNSLFGATSPSWLYNFRAAAGVTITAGQAVYLDSSTNTWKLARADGTAAQAACVGLAANGASPGQLLTVQVSGGVEINGAGGSGLAVADVVLLSTSGTPGNIMQCAIAANANALTAGQYLTIIGWGVDITTADTIVLNSNATGVTHA